MSSHPSLVVNRGTSQSRSSRDSKKTGETELQSHKEAQNQYHCLEEACILVRVPSSCTYGGEEEETGIRYGSDASLAAYAQHVEELEASKRKGASAQFEESSPSISVDSDDVQYDYFNTELDDQKQGSASLPRDLDSSAFDDCTHFMDNITFAKELVKGVISESEVKVAAALPPESPKVTDQDKEEFDGVMAGFRESMDFGYIETKKSFTSWPTIESFTIEIGAFKIDEYLASVETEEDWMYVIYYRGTEDLNFSSTYKYQAIFSLPTWRYPIAQATASIYFTIEVCEAKPHNCPVDVTFKYETFGHKFKPGNLDFEEKWLHYILDSKIKLFKSVTY